MPRKHRVRSQVSWASVLACAGLLLAGALALTQFGWTPAAFGQAQGPVQGRPQTGAPQTQTSFILPFRAVSYDVYASLEPSLLSLTGKATVDFVAQQPSSTVICELNPGLRVNAVRNEAGQGLSFDRSDAEVRVSLQDPVAVGQHVKLTFEYFGQLNTEDNNPGSGIRTAWMSADSAYLLQPARWFPLTGYPANAYTGVFHLEVPKEFVVAGTGVVAPPAAPDPAALSQSSQPVTPTPAVSPDATATPPVLVRNAGRNGSRTAAEQPARETKPAPPPPAAPAPAPVLGNAAPQPPAGNRVVYTFRVDKPGPAGSFVAGTFKMVPVQAEGLDVSVYVHPGSEATAQNYGEEAARIAVAFSNQFGPLPTSSLTLAQMPDNTMPGFAGPGLLLVSQRQWTTPQTNSRLLSNLIASLWWGNQVLPASPNDVWLTAGLSRYSEALYIEQTAGVGGLNKALDDFAVGALMYEGTAPIAEAGRLAPFSPEYTSIAVNKGAMVFHMLREQLGDSAFFSILGDLYRQYAGRGASIADFEKLAQDRASKLTAGPGGAASENGSSPNFALGNNASSQPTDNAVNLGPFFAQWVNSTGVPEFSVDYTVYRTTKGFRINGKVKQNLDFFHMPVELEIQTEGNPEYKTIPVSGTESSFDIEVFGRPKQSGITLDPHNYILKSSPKLQVRAIVARGEAFAEQGRYYDALQQYSQALEQQKNDALAEFRMGEAFFYQKNYSAAANTFRDALDGDMDTNSKWVEVWSHIYLGKIYDIAGDRTRAVNEYSKAQATNDDTGGAQAEAQKYLTMAFSGDTTTGPVTSGATTTTPSTPASPSSNSNSNSNSNSDKPVLRHRDQDQ